MPTSARPTLSRTPCCPHATGHLPHFLSPCHCETSDRCHWLWQSAPPCKKNVIARPVRKPVVAIRTPVPSAPLPKGGRHGEAVTGGFFSRPPGRAHGPCPTRCLVIGAGRTGSSAPTNRSVGATLAVARPPIPFFPLIPLFPQKSSGAYAPPLHTISSPPHSTPFSSKYARV